MKVIVCVDKKGGMMFNNRRQSQDRVLREKIAEILNGATLYMNSYSAKQFKGECSITVDEEFLSVAGKDDFCFVENLTVTPDTVNEFYIFNWNRKYPADFYFDIKPRELGFKPIKTEEFQGSSHEKITLEVFAKV